MNPIETLLELFPDLAPRLKKHPRTVIYRGKLTLTQLQTLRRAFPGLDDRTPGVFKIPLPEDYTLPQSAPPQDPYAEWCRRISYHFPELTPLPSRALWQSVTADHFTQLLTALSQLPKRNPWTWSGLGSHLFNNSKCLRTGALRDWIECVQDYFDLVVEDNPYTACVVSFFCGVDAIPRARTLEEVLHLRLERLPTAIRSYENAEPFRRATKTAHDGDVLIYTEGYPNHAVRLLLQKLPQEILYQHFGDTDADGFMIAERLFQAHPGTMVQPPPNAPTRRLTAAQRDRIKKLLIHAPDPHLFPYTALIRLLQANTWVEQESWS